MGGNESTTCGQERTNHKVSKTLPHMVMKFKLKLSQEISESWCMTLLPDMLIARLSFGLLSCALCSHIDVIYFGLCVHSKVNKC